MRHYSPRTEEAYGYYASFALGLPTGASMVALAGAFYVASLAVRCQDG